MRRCATPTVLAHVERSSTASVRFREPTRLPCDARLEAVGRRPVARGWWVPDMSRLANGAIGGSGGPTRPGARVQLPGSGQNALMRTAPRAFLARLPGGIHSNGMAAPTITEAVVLRSFAFRRGRPRAPRLHRRARTRRASLRRAFAGRRAASAGASSRSRTSSSSSIGAAASSGRSPARRSSAPTTRSATDPYRLQVGLVGLEAMLRLYTEEEQNDRAFLALTRFLDALDAVRPSPDVGPRSTRSCSRSS